MTSLYFPISATKADSSPTTSSPDSSSRAKDLPLSTPLADRWSLGLGLWPGDLRTHPLFLPPTIPQSQQQTLHR